MRLVVIAGVCGSGKTTQIAAASEGRRFTFIANNEESRSRLEGIAAVTDSFPFKSPCARVRQFAYRTEMHASDDVPVIVSEPPGNCLEQSSPMLNPIYASKRDEYDLGPLITCMDGRVLCRSVITKRSTEGLRMYHMIEESDVIAVTFSDLLSDEDRFLAAGAVRAVNDECEIVFCSGNGEGSGRLSELIFGDAHYSRPLYY